MFLFDGEMRRRSGCEMPGLGAAKGHVAYSHGAPTKPGCRTRRKPAVLFLWSTALSCSRWRAVTASADPHPTSGPQESATAAPGWLVVHTKPRCEKKLAVLLAREKFPYDLPLVQSVRRYRTQTKRFTKPLFPGYVFAQIDPGRRHRLFQQDLIVRFLDVPNQAALAQQLESIRRMITAGFDLYVTPLLKKGRGVRVVGGPLHGLEGMVHDPDHPQGIVVAVDVLQKGVLIRLPPENLRVLP